MRGLSRARVLGVAVTVVVVAAVAAGILLLGSPAEERARRLDERRVQDLVGIARALDLYWTRHGRLPVSLDELREEPGAGVRATDPGTGDVYEYEALDAASYELCARFETEPGEGGRFAAGGFWSHGAGRQCFRREASRIF